ncbi:MAG: carbohydrate ABC transporter permease [Meiothermus sp.]|nr:carbohydrate ABC transporter permease [Meiothermus sp.]
MRSKSPLYYVQRFFFYLLVVFIIVYSVFPFYWAVVSSFKPSSELFNANPSFLPVPFTLVHYNAVFGNNNFLRNLWNSLVVAGGATLISLLLGIAAAYALGRLRFPPKNWILYLVLAMTMFPQVSVLSGLFVLLRETGLFNSYAGLILSYLLFTLPFTVWVLTGYFRGLPRELEEAAYVDGATPLQTLIQVMLPLCGPGLVTTGLLAFIAAWNEYLFALTFTIGERAKTVPVAIAQFGGASAFEVPWGAIMAASVVVTVPLVILVLVFQQRIVAGLTAGAVKG